MNNVVVKPTLSELRQLIGGIETHERERSAFTSYPSGFPTGCIIEISGTAKTSFISKFLAEHPEFKVAWLEEDISVNPYGLFQSGVDLQNVLFIETKNELQWCLTQALHSGCFKVLVTYTKKIEEKDLRRYQLLCEKNHSHFFILSESPHQSWVPKLQLNVKRINQTLNVEILKKRGHG